MRGFQMFTPVPTNTKCVTYVRISAGLQPSLTLSESHCFLGLRITTSVDHGSNREPCGAVRPQTELCATSTVRFTPQTAPRRHGSVHGGCEPPRFVAVRHVSPNRHSTLRFFIVRDIFSRAFDTLAQQVSFPSSCAYAQIVFADTRVAAAFRFLFTSPPFAKRSHFLTLFVFTHSDPPLHSRVRSYFSSLCSFSVFNDRILAAFAHSPHSTDAFWQLLLNCSIRQSHFSCSSSLPRRTGTPFSRTITFLPLSLTQHIRRSRFGNFCNISAFDSRILAAFLLSHVSPAPHSRVRSHCCIFRSLSTFDGRVLATFAQLQHSTVAF